MCIYVYVYSIYREIDMYVSRGLSHLSAPRGGNAPRLRKLSRLFVAVIVYCAAYYLKY